jgi:phosphate-selective porin OprO/OprP
LLNSINLVEFGPTKKRRSRGRIGESDTFWGLEAAGVWGPVSVQGEYTQTEVELPTGTTMRTNPPTIPSTTNPFIGDPDPTFSGWYVDASWFLSGETRPYKDGVFQRVKVKHPLRWNESSGWGAWQLAARYDVIDLSDTAFNNAGGCRNTALYPGVNATGTPTPPANASIAQCGEQTTWLVGVNWYLNDYVRLFFNYTESELSSYPITTIGSAGTAQYPAGTKVSGFDDAKIRGFGMRAHVDW